MFPIFQSHVTRLFCALVAVLLLGGIARAQNQSGCDQHFDPGCQISQLTEWSSSATIPVGTHINEVNWQKYKTFMPVAWQMIFSGQYPIKLPPGDEMVVGPDTDISPPTLYSENTEKYSEQVGLKQLPTDGYVPTNYQSGLPFPKIQINDPLAGAKVIYNYYYHWAPEEEMGGESKLTVLDKYGNQASTVIQWTFFHLSHLSDPNYPMNPSGNEGWFKTEYLEVEAPEQARYAASLTAFHDNPSLVEEHYAFIPALRRSLRLSGGARCAPVEGTDFVQDDLEVGFGGQPSGFMVKYLGDKKVLALVNLNRELFNSADTAYQQRVAPDFFPVQWTVPEAGKWELRDVQVMSIVRLPKDGGESYCYGPRILYMDKQTGAGLSSDLYDRNGKYWKSEQIRYALTPVQWCPGRGSGLIAYHIGGPSNAIDSMYDFQSNHISATFNKDGRRDCDIPKEFQNRQRYAFPGGLSMVMQ